MASNYSPKIVTDGLVLCLDAADKNSYPGSGTTWYDLSGNGNNGTLSAAAIGTDVPGNMDFNGSDEYIDLGNDSSLDLTSNISVFAWVYWTGAGGEDVIYSNGSGEGTGALLQTRTSTTTRIINNYDGGYYLSDSTAFGANAWYHVGYTFNVSTTTIQGYSNASLGGSDASATASGRGVTDATIGKASWTDGRYWIGKINIVNVYNRTLSAKEISQNFNAQRSRFGL